MSGMHDMSQTKANDAFLENMSHPSWRPNNNAKELRKGTLATVANPLDSVGPGRFNTKPGPGGFSQKRFGVILNCPVHNGKIYYRPPGGWTCYDTRGGAAGASPSSPPSGMTLPFQVGSNICPSDFRRQPSSGGSRSGCRLSSAATSRHRCLWVWYWSFSQLLFDESHLLLLVFLPCLLSASSTVRCSQLVKA